MMPVMNGWELLEIRERDIYLASIPVVVVSAAGERAKDASATGYIKKPVDIEVLLETIRQYCGASSVSQDKAS
jgi:CheY-like chemotaxis protein